MLISGGLIYSLHTPDEGKMRDISMLHHSNLLEQLKEHTHIFVSIRPLSFKMQLFYDFRLFLSHFNVILCHMSYSMSALSKTNLFTALI